MSVTKRYNRMCNGAIASTSQPHGEELIPVDTNEPTSYIGRWDVSRTANDSVRAYLLGSANNYELHFYGYGATANYASLSTAPYYTAPWASYTSGINSIVFHNGIADVGQLNFFGRVSTNPNPGNLKKVAVTFSSTVRVLQRYAIYCTPLLSVDLGKGLRKMGEAALYASSDNQTIDFPLSLQIANYSAIQGYTGSGATNYSYLKAHTPSGGFFIVGDGVLLWGKPTGTIWTIPEGIKSVCCFPWDNRVNVTAVTLPSTTKYIAFGAFATYSNLQKIKLPRGTERIYGLAFQNCTNLTKIWIPRSVKIVDTSSIVTNTGEYSYTSYPFTGCSNLTIYCEIDSSEIPEGWSEYWNYIASGTQATVVWNTSEAVFDNL